MQMTGNEAKRASLFGALFLLGASAAFAQTPDGPMVPRPDVPIQQAPKRAETTIKARVVLVNAPVTVRDSKDQIVTSLEAKDFQLTDHGVPQTITHFDVGGDPISLVALFETSSRVVPLLPAVQKSGIIITETILGANGEAAVLGFNDSIDKLLPFSKNADEIQSSVWHLQAGTSGSRLYDAMAVGVEMLTGLPEATATTPGRRRVLLVVSEATDFGSQTKLGEVLRKAQLANITIYSVGLSTTRALLQAEPKKNHTDISPPGTYPLPPIPGKPPIPEEEDPRLNDTVDLMALAVWAVSHVADKVSAHALEVAAAATGGAHFATFRDRTVEKALDEIGGELHTQYTIGYSPTGTSESGYHEIKVSLVDAKYKNLKLRSRPGYYVAGSDE
ncbi:MAG TPA: VWA domain-containing protein [Candidatus Dormibacteraeota bacterium]|jgi:VWFA-related protein|nr:VWA domain-containing protein [Candidatus Dormibacteraeota bacterium]